MSDDNHFADLVSWSRIQAEHLRRVADGGSPQGVDWPRVIALVEDAGLHELNAVRLQLELALSHALKVFAWPDHMDRQHWVEDTAIYFANARHRFRPSMAGRLEVASLYASALRDVERLPMDKPAAPLPRVIALTEAEVVSDAFRAGDLLDRIAATLSSL